ncbi:galactosyltransferase-related protein [Aeromonas caviae]|uniref:galactosyltransferase-related protein n=1 Tax=Aeromonas caviae TaxID=648 RepID=UPI0038D19407
MTKTTKKTSTSIIIPYSERYLSTNDVRLEVLCEQIINEIQCEILVCCSGRLKKSRDIWLETNTNIKRTNIPAGKIFNQGLARNNSSNISSCNYLFFLDVDLVCSPHINSHLIEFTSDMVIRPTQAFEMFPCLYLTKEETARFDGDFQGCLESFLRGENHRVEGIALASSCLLMNREWFLQLGGFDEQFVGHGGEDLELIDRLTRHYPIGPRPDDYALNAKAQHPGDYQGFRRYFSYYALPHLFAGRFLVHQWHPRPLTHPYHKRRAGNDQLLEQMLSRSEAERGPLKGPVVPCNDLNGELPDFREWMIRLQEEAGYPVSEYPGLLRWQDGITLRRPLWRKVRKLYLNPRAFFRDMFKPTSR